MSAGKVLIGIMAGMAAGTVLGVLYAPEKGSVTRKKISKKSEDYADAVKGKFGDFIDDVSKKLDEIKTEVSGLSQKGKEKLNETKKNLVASN